MTFARYEPTYLCDSRRQTYCCVINLGIICVPNLSLLISPIPRLVPKSLIFAVPRLVPRLVQRFVPIFTGSGTEIGTEIFLNYMITGKIALIALVRCECSFHTETCQVLQLDCRNADANNSEFEHLSLLVVVL